MAEHEIWEPLQCKTAFNTYLSFGRSNKKVEESGLAFFGQIGLAETFPTQMKYTNTQTHKYTNTAYDKVPETPNMWYIFEKRIVQGYQK